MTFDLWPDSHGHVKRTKFAFHTVWMPELASFGTFAGDMDMVRCCEVTSMVYTNIVTFPRSTEVIRVHWPIMTSEVIFGVFVLPIVIVCADFEFGIRFFYSLCVEIGSVWSWHTPHDNLTLAPAGGGWFQPPPPLRFFADSEKTAARSAAKFAIAVQPTIWHISKKTTTRWPQRSRDQVAVSDLTSSCVFRSLTSCQRHTSDPNSLKLTMYSRSMGVYNLYISDFLYRWP